MDRRAQLLAAATDDALEHGVIGLSLRPVAARIGTSDRMLVYHFGTRDALVAAIIEESTDRSVAVVDALPAEPGVGAAVRVLWEQHRGGELDRCQRVYAQAAAQGLLGDDRSSAVVARVNAGWLACVARYLVRCGADPARAVRCAEFVDAAISGLHLDLYLTPAADVDQVVADVAEAAAALAAPSGRMAAKLRS